MLWESRRKRGGWGGVFWGGGRVRSEDKRRLLSSSFAPQGTREKEPVIVVRQGGPKSKELRGQKGTEEGAACSQGVGGGGGLSRFCRYREE